MSTTIATTPDAMHPQARRILDAITASGEPPLETLDVAEGRRIADERVIRTNMPGEEVRRVEDVVITGPGGPLTLRVYTPEVPAASGTLPILFYIHGGGWTVGNLDTHDPQCRHFANSVGCLVVAVAYRLAPEHKFPAAVEDVLAAADWIARQAPAHGGDPLRVAVAGDSSGGTLSATVAQQMRGREDIRIRLQVLIYPGTDLRMATPSYARLGEGNFLTAAKMRWFVDHYLRDATDAANPLASPVLVEDCAGLPPALLLTAGLDPLLDEGIAYADRLRAAGVSVEHVDYPGWPHGFFFWAGTDAAADATQRVEAALRAALR